MVHVWRVTLLPPILRVKCAVNDEFIEKEARRYYAWSGRKMACAVCGYSKSIQIRHLKPIAEYDDYDLVVVVNSLSNLVALCPTHTKEHKQKTLSSSALQMMRAVSRQFPCIE